jgi:hypothetical protein
MDPVEIQQVINDPRANPTMVLALACDPETDVEFEDYQRLVNHPALTSAFVLDVIRESSDYAMAYMFAADSADPRVLAELATHGETRVRCAVAFSARTPVSVLRVLARDPVPLVRGNLPFNRHLPPELLCALTVDPSPVVRDAVNEAFSTEFGQWLGGRGS